MRKERFNNQKGIALILTLTIIVILAALAVELDYLVRVNISNAATTRDHTKALYIAKTGINIAFSLLKDDTNGHDSLHEDWGKFDEYSALSHLLLDEGSFSGAIGDEAGKININKLVKQDDHLDDIRKEQLKKLFTILGLSGKYEDIDTIIDDIADWIDKDNSTATFETEDEYYTSLQDPYTCKNGPLEIQRLTFSVAGVWNIQDRSYSISPEFYYKSRSNLHVKVKGTVNEGKPFTEFGEKANDWEMQISLTYFFNFSFYQLLYPEEIIQDSLRIWR